MKVQRFVELKFPDGPLRRRHRQRALAVHVLYGKDLELRLLVPRDIDAETARIIRPLRARPIDDVEDLVGRLSKLATLGREVTIYPDAEELINRRLFATRIAAKVAEIRKNVKRHPLRKDLLKTELLPYQLDGVCFAVGAGRSILADDMGLGKTIQGIGVPELLTREAGISKVLIGHKPDAPVDETESEKRAREAEGLARRENVAAAGGQLLAAGLALFGELLGPRAAAEAAPAVVNGIRDRLADCIERDERGRTQLGIVLSDDSLLERIAETLSRLVKG